MVSSNDEWAGAIGWVIPGALERSVVDFIDMTPPDVNLVLYTKLWAKQMMQPGRFDADAFGKRRGEILEAARELVDYLRVDCLAVTGDLIQAAMGPEWTRELQADLESETGKPVTTAMTAVTDSLEHLGARRVAVASPWRPDQNEYVRAYLEGSGFEVSAIRDFDTADAQAVIDLDPETVYTQSVQVLEDAGGADAIYAPCPLWRGASQAIQRIEDECGVPVLAFFNPVLWRCLRMIGHTGTIKGYGSLLARGSQSGVTV